LPFILLYEVGIVVARVFGRKRSESEDDSTDLEPK
jgi:Sec-independent protein secretion pathway component TatC